MGGDRAMRDVARYYSLFYDQPELSHRGAPDYNAAGAAAAATAEAVGQVSAPRQEGAAADVHQHDQQLQQQDRVGGGMAAVTAPEQVQLAVWTAAEEGRSQQEGAREGQEQGSGQRGPGAVVEGVEGVQEQPGRAGSGSGGGGGGGGGGIAALCAEHRKGERGQVEETEEGQGQGQQEDGGHIKGGVDRNAEAVQRVLTTLYPDTFVELVPVIKVGVVLGF